MRLGFEATGLVASPIETGWPDLFEYRLRKVGPTWAVHIIGETFWHHDFAAAKRTCAILERRGYVDGDVAR